MVAKCAEVALFEQGFGIMPCMGTRKKMHLKSIAVSLENVYATPQLMHLGGKRYPTWIRASARKQLNCHREVLITNRSTLVFIYPRKLHNET